ncbi:MAG: hypothetical protein ONB05_08785, partial [candidate division KSB1 bacterium]|nr:hypothetical protein [candidate division KSB1 bacterium]
MQDIKKILVSRLRFIGDIILTTPVIKVLRETFPQAHIAYLAESPYISLLKNNPHLDELIGFDRLSLKNLRDQVRFLTELRQRRFDLAIDLLGNPRSALQIWATGARYRVGGDFRGRKYFYNIRVRQDRPGLSAIEFHLQSLKYLGIDYDLRNLQTEVFTTPEEDRWAENYLIAKGIDLQKPLVGIHPGGTWPA